MKEGKFLYEWKRTRGAFKRPRLRWYFGPWSREGNMPFWRTGNTIHFCKKEYRNDKYSAIRLESSEWTEEGKKRHPILSRLVKPTYELPLWLSFYFFNHDIYWKTREREEDFRYEWPAHITLVFFGLALSVTAYIPMENDRDWSVEDDYWESLLTYNYFNGDLKKTNDEMGGWYLSPGKTVPSFRTSFLTNQVDRDDLWALQREELEKMNKMDVGDPEAFEKECEEMNKHIEDYV